MASKKQCGTEARQIAERVAAEHGFTLAELGTPSRKAKLSYARFAIMHALYATGHYSLRSIGELVNRDTWSTQYGVKRFPQMTAPSGQRKAQKKRKNKPRTYAESKAAHANNMLKQRLVWRYGRERAASILAGTDPATNADIAKWNALGEPKAGAHKERAGL